MRDLISRIVWNPWVYRITCLVLFLVGMALVRYGLHVLRETNDTGLILEIGLPILAAIFLFAWLYDRHNARPH